MNTFQMSNKHEYNDSEMCIHCLRYYPEIAREQAPCISFNETASASEQLFKPQLTHPPRLMCDPEYVETEFVGPTPQISVDTEKPYKGILTTDKENGLVLTDRLSVTLDSAHGDDDDIARIARHDQQGGTFGIINYMVKHRHGSPFEFGHMVFKCELPLFVIQQMLRHRIGVSYSQWSLRWDEAPPRIYMPSINRPMIPLDGKQANIRKNKYGTHTEEQHFKATTDMLIAFETSYNMYRRLLQQGVAQELARIVLPAAQMSIIHVGFNPRSLMHFLSLRIDHVENRYESHPQWEVEQVARKFEHHFSRQWPITWDAFCKNGRVAP